MTLAMDIDDYIEREKVNWIAVGEAKGIVKGEVKARHDIALRMLQDGLSVEQIARVTGLPVEEVRQLRCEQ